jgi:hypothetical protein
MRNWKTTLLGIGAGVLNLVANGMTWKQALLSTGLAALGFFAKDKNVTGGDTRQ